MVGVQVWPYQASGSATGALLMAIRREHFKVTGKHFNGAGAAKVTITDSGGVQLFSVRPARRRKPYDWPLNSVAQWVLEQSVKNELAAKKKEKDRRR